MSDAVPFWVASQQPKKPTEQQPENEVLKAALIYAQRGWYVVPVHAVTEQGVCTCGNLQCKNPGKHPVTQNGVDDSTTDAGQIRQWWTRYSFASVGIDCGRSGILGIDIDPRNGGDITMREVEAKHGELGDALTVSSGGGGLHHYFARPAGDFRGALGPGVDVKSHGYLIAPPSKHVSGGEYTWMDDALEMMGGDLPQPPDWLVELLKIDRPAHNLSSVAVGLDAPSVELSPREVARIESALQSIDPDPRDSWLAVGMALHACGDGATGWQIWVKWSAQSKKYDEQVQARTWRSFRNDKPLIVTLGTLFELAKRQGWIDTTSADIEGQSLDLDMQVTPSAEPSHAPPSAESVSPYINTTPGQAPINAPVTLPGRLGELVDWINDTAPNPQPLLSPLIALAIGSVVCSRVYTTEYENYSSVYLISVARSGSGKEYGKKAIERVLDAADLSHLIGTDGYSSGSAVFSGAYRRPSHIAIIDEMGRLLGSAKAQGQQHRTDAMTQLMECFGRCDGTLRPRGLSTHGLADDVAEKIMTKKVVRPGISLYGMTTPDNFYNALDDSLIADGFLSRLVVGISDAKRTVPRLKSRRDVPEDFASWLHDLRYPASMGAMADVLDKSPTPDAAASPVTLAVPSVVHSDWAVFVERQQGYQAELEGEGLAELANRWGEIALRLSLILTLSIDSNATAISRKAFKAASELVEFHGRRFIEIARTRIGEGSEHAQTVGALYRLLMSKPGEAMGKREFARHNRTFKGMKPREQGDVFQSLMDRESIIVRKSERRQGSDKLIYTG